MATSILQPESLLYVINSDKNIKSSMFTIKSRKTQKDFTFKLVKKTFHDKQYLHIYVEVNYMQFKYVGFYWEGKIYRSHKEVTSISAKVASWLFRQLQKQKMQELKQNVELFHLGKCLCCGRTLTDAESIEAGIGPKCRQLVA
jgi:hypothetical protein